MTRAFHIDRIWVILTALVILHHTAITYGAPGGWYYKENPTPAKLSGLLLILFVSVNQAYFIGFFFFIAGYFMPASYDYKGLGRFASDRLIRLGVPLAVFTAFLDPLTNAIAERAGAHPFWRGFLDRVAAGDWHNGPLWFAQALLIFSVGYMLWRGWHGRVNRQPDSPLPLYGGLAL